MCNLFDSMQIQQQHQEELQAEQESHCQDLRQALQQHKEDLQAQQASHSQDQTQAQQQQAGWRAQAQAQHEAQVHACSLRAEAAVQELRHELEGVKGVASGLKTSMTDVSKQAKDHKEKADKAHDALINERKVSTCG